MTRYEFIRSIVDDPEHPGEMLLDLGDELCEHMGWKAGDSIEWIDNGDGTWLLRKKSNDNKSKNI
jgi:hypothetical protein